jgi:hypothetical protein
MNCYKHLSPFFLTVLGCLFFLSTSAQKDSTFQLDNKSITLTPAVIYSNLNVDAFIQHIKKDTSFYKAFKNLRIAEYTSSNSVFIFDKGDEVQASLNSKTQQFTKNGCRWMKVLEEKTTGDFYDRKREYNYYTASLYAGLFFTKDTVCGETNIIGKEPFSVKDKSGIEKHKEQLKLLFFNPGMPISGIPFIGNKVSIFEPPMDDLYDFIIDLETKNGLFCYVFKIIPRQDLTRGERSKLVIDQMITWFDPNDWQIVARNYDLSYKAGIYEFDVKMEAVLSKINGVVYPTILRYNGNWKVIGKKRENASFTATLYDFK